LRCNGDPESFQSDSRTDDGRVRNLRRAGIDGGAISDLDGFVASVAACTRRFSVSAYIKIGTSGLALIAGAGTWLWPDTSAGWIFVLLSFVVVLLVPTIRGDIRLCMTLWATIAAHVIVAGVDAFYWVLPVAAPDASTFHRAATQIAATQSFEFGLDFIFYENLLAGLYAIAGSLRWVGNMFSVFLFSLSCVVLVDLCRRLHGEKNRITVTLIFGLLPSALLLNSVTLREGWELLFFMVCTYAAIVLPDSDRKPLWLLVLIVAALAMGLPHKVMLLYSVFLVPLLLGYVGYVDSNITSKSAIIVGLSVSIVLLAAIAGLVTLTESGRSLILGMIDGNLIDEIRLYREHINLVGDPRTAYGIQLDASSYVAIAKSMMSLYFHYLVAAPVQGIENSKDLYAVFESVLRIALLVASVVAAFRLRGRPELKLVVMLLLVYVSLTMLWSIGTTNYGQAIRHHVLTNWILILLGVPILGQFASRLGKR